MEVILRQEVPSLGREGDIVKVASGYANNYLIPKGLAALATPGNLKQLEQKRAAIGRREAVLMGKAEEVKAKLDGKSITITAKAGAEGRLYGSVTTKDIAKAIEEQLGLAVDRKRLEPPEPIKQAGDATVTLRLYPEVAASIEVKIVPEQVEAEVTEEEAAEVIGAVEPEAEETEAEEAGETETGESEQS